jgi:hypothetical protein
MMATIFCYRCHREVDECKPCDGCGSSLCEHCFTVCQDGSCLERGQDVADWDNDELCAMCMHHHDVDDLGELLDELDKD